MNTKARLERLEARHAELHSSDYHGAQIRENLLKRLASIRARLEQDPDFKERTGPEADAVIAKVRARLGEVLGR